MNTNLTEIAVVVDRSGSMQGTWSDTIGGLQAFLAEQKKLPGEASFSLTVFDDVHEMPYRREPIARVDLSQPTFGPRGSTALYDALGRTITGLGQQLAALPEDQRPGKVLVAIFTDGQENASVEYSREQVLAMMRHQEDKYQWTFLFLAAGAEAAQEAQNLGVAPQRTVQYDATGQANARAYRTLNAVVASTRSADPAAYRRQRDNLDLTEVFETQAEPAAPPKKARRAKRS